MMHDQQNVKPNMAFIDKYVIIKRFKEVWTYS